MHSFTINYEWKQLTDRMPVWGLDPEHKDYIIELVIEERGNDSYTILHRKYTGDDMEYDTVTDVTLSYDSVHKLKELVAFLAYNITEAELIEHHEWVTNEFMHINPETPGEALLDILDFLKLNYQYKHSTINTPKTTGELRQH